VRSHSAGKAPIPDCSHHYVDRHLFVLESIALVLGTEYYRLSHCIAKYWTSNSVTIRCWCLVTFEFTKSYQAFNKMMRLFLSLQSYESNSRFFIWKLLFVCKRVQWDKSYFPTVIIEAAEQLVKGSHYWSTHLRLALPLFKIFFRDSLLSIGNLSLFAEESEKSVELAFHRHCRCSFASTMLNSHICH